jgi:4-amino-4-deoxy-L-arabinose transferase-like glycosyltransferase
MGDRVHPMQHPAVAAGGPAVTTRWSERRVLTVLWIVATAWAMFYMASRGLLTRPPLPGHEEPEIARHVAMGHGFRSPFDRSPDAPMTSWSPPLYVYLMAGVFKVFGVWSPQSAAVLTTLNAICYGACAAGLYVLGRRLLLPSAGLVAAGLFMLGPHFMRWVSLIWDTYVALALFVWLLVWGVSIGLRGRATAGRLAALGLGIGLLCLTNAGYVMTAPVIVLTALRGAPWRRKFAMSAIAVAAFVASVVPWTIRNYLVFDRLFFIRDSARFELWFGNLPWSTGWLHPGHFDSHPGSRSHRERQAILTRGESAYFAYCKERFDEQFKQDPSEFVRRTALRAAYCFLSDPTEYTTEPGMPNIDAGPYVLDRVLLNGGLTACGLAGAFVAWRLRYRAGAILAAGLLSVLPFVPISVWDRQLIGLRAMLVVTTAFLLVTVFIRVRTGRWLTGDDVRLPVEPA